MCLVALPYLLVAFGCFPMPGGGAGLLVAGASANPNSLEGGEEGDTFWGSENVIYTSQKYRNKEAQDDKRMPSFIH